MIVIIEVLSMITIDLLGVSDSVLVTQEQNSKEEKIDQQIHAENVSLELVEHTFSKDCKCLDLNIASRSIPLCEIKEWKRRSRFYA